MKFLRPSAPLGLAAAALIFLLFELILRTKLGTIFYLVMAWGTLQLSLLGRLEGSPSPVLNGEKLLEGVYYAFAVCAAIFVVFAALNIALRSVDNSWTYFQLP